MWKDDAGTELSELQSIFPVVSIRQLQTLFPRPSYSFPNSWTVATLPFRHSPWQWIHLTLDGFHEMHPYCGAKTLFQKQSWEKWRFTMVYCLTWDTILGFQNLRRTGAFHLTSGADNCESTVGPWACLGVGLLMPTKGSTGKCPSCRGTWGRILLEKMLEGLIRDTEPWVEIYQSTPIL